MYPVDQCTAKLYWYVSKNVLVSIEVNPLPQSAITWPEITTSAVMREWMAAATVAAFWSWMDQVAKNQRCPLTAINIYWYDDHIPVTSPIRSMYTNSRGWWTVCS